MAARAENVVEWFKIRGAGLSGKTTAAWLSIFGAADIAAMPCHTMESLPADEHLRALGLPSREQHPTEGTVTAIRCTVQVDGRYPHAGAWAEPPGWSTRTMLADTGCSAGEIGTILGEGGAVEAPR